MSEWEEVFAAMRSAGWAVVAFSPEEIKETGLEAYQLEESMSDNFDCLVDYHEQMKNEESEDE